MDAMEFQLYNGKVVWVREDLVKSIVTTRLSNCFAADCHMDKSEIIECLHWVTRHGDARNPGKCVEHMLFYAENLVLSTYLYLLSEGRNADSYLKHMMPVLKKARKLAEKARKMLEKGKAEKAQKIANEMLWLLLNNGIDPW